MLWPGSLHVMGRDREPVSAERLQAAKRHAKDQLLTIDGVQGIGIGGGTLRLYVRDAGVAGALPDEVDGVPVTCVVVDEITAY